MDRVQQAQSEMKASADAFKKYATTLNGCGCKARKYGSGPCKHMEELAASMDAIERGQRAIAILFPTSPAMAQAGREAMARMRAEEAAPGECCYDEFGPCGCPECVAAFAWPTSADEMESDARDWYYSQRGC